VPVKDAELLKTIARIGDHYQRNINNRYIRNALTHLSIPQVTWDRIERLTAKSGYAELNGYQYEELYEMVVAAATLVSTARKRIVPNVRSLVGKSGGRASGTNHGENVLREMAFTTLAANLGILADQVNELYLKVIELDKRDHTDTKCIYERLPELKELGKLLIAAE